MTTTTTTPKRLVDVHEIAAILATDRKAVEAMRRRAGFPQIKCRIGRRPAWFLGEVLDFAAGQAR
jgi:predicted DNA-binding transcriptional regulator AlpA